MRDWPPRIFHGCAHTVAVQGFARIVEPARLEIQLQVQQHKRRTLAIVFLHLICCYWRVQLFLCLEQKSKLQGNHRFFQSPRFPLCCLLNAGNFIGKHVFLAV